LGLDLANYSEKLFKPYTIFHADIEGKGIGLYLVQSQVQMLGSKIAIESTVGIGTTFTINIALIPNTFLI
jgi:signal transduction histidine kinase